MFHFHGNILLVASLLCMLRLHHGTMNGQFYRHCAYVLIETELAKLHMFLECHVLSSECFQFLS